MALKIETGIQDSLSFEKESFAGQDIRGMDFSNKRFGGVDFSGSFSGQKLSGFFLSNLVLLLLLCLGSVVIGFSWAAPIVLLDKIQKKTDSIEMIELLVIFAGLVVLLGSLLYLRTIFTKNVKNFLYYSSVIYFAIVIFLLLSMSSTTAFLALLALTPLFLASTFSGLVITPVVFTGFRFLYNQWVCVLILACSLAPAAYGYYTGAALKGGKARLIEANDQPGFIATFLIVELIVLSASIYIGSKCKASSGERFQGMFQLSRALSSIGGTKFYGANLTDCNFANADLSKADFREALLKRVNWSGAKALNSARWDGTLLDNITVRNLVGSKKANGLNLQDMDLRNLNLDGVDLLASDLSGSDFSESTLRGANLEKAKLARTRLYGADLSKSCLTGAFIQDWAIATDTVFRDVECDYVYMRLPTEGNPDAWRKPDNRNEFFEKGDFSDFIAPIVRTLDLYQQPELDMIKVADTFKTLDLYHYHGIDPSAASIALKQMAVDHPGVDMEVVALEGRGADKVKLQLIVSNKADQSSLSQEYFDRYSEISSLPYADIQSLMTSISEKDDHIRRLEEILTTAVSPANSVYIETQYNLEPKSEDDPEKQIDKKTILLLSANPKNTKRLRLDEEVRELQKSFDMAINREDFEIEQRWAVTVEDVRRALLSVKPTVVHFSGHGVGENNSSGNYRSIEDEEEQGVASDSGGIALEDEFGNVEIASSEVLADLFGLHANQVECIVLNSCYSESQADELVKFIPYVVCMEKEIGDSAAISFSVGFYDALLAGRSIEFSFESGWRNIRLSKIPEHLTPVLKKREGVTIDNDEAS